MHLYSRLASVGFALAIGGCYNGQLIDSIARYPEIQEYKGGAVFGYYLPKGVATVSIDYTESNSGPTSLKIGEIKDDVVPDTMERYFLRYEKRALSSETIDIKSENGLITSITTTDDDKTIAAVQKGVDVLEEVSNVVEAIEKEASARIARAFEAESVREEKPPSQCGNISVEEYIPFIEPRFIEEKKYYLGNSGNCYIEYSINIKRENSASDLYKGGPPRREFELRDPHPAPEIDNNCFDSVCFRIPDRFEITIESSVWRKSPSPAKKKVEFSGGAIGKIENFELGKPFTFSGSLKMDGSIAEAVQFHINSADGIVTGAIGLNKSYLSLTGKETQRGGAAVYELHGACPTHSGAPCQKFSGDLKITSGGIYVISITGDTGNSESVENSSSGRFHPVATSTKKVVITAPARQPLGMVHFARRKFVNNQTTATFNSGMLTQLKVVNPSEVDAFLSLPVEILKAVPILIAIN